MHYHSSTHEPHLSPPSTAALAQRYARLGGLLFLVSMFAGFFGEYYVPSSLIVSGDAAATARNITASPIMFRLSFAAYLVEAVCDISLAWILYVLLRPVGRNVSLLAAFFGLVSTATFAVTELFYFAPSFILGDSAYLASFTSDQVNGLAMLSIKLYGYGSGAFMVFYGFATLIRGLLVYRSDYLPRLLGVLMVLAGLGFIIRNFLLITAPAFAYDLLLLPMFVAGLSLTVWFLAKGIDAGKWNANPASRFI